MPHADALSLPPDLTTKTAFYEHINETLYHLLGGGGGSNGTEQDEDRQHWITALANASSLLYGSYENFESQWGREDGSRVNWSGFYLVPSLFSNSSKAPPQPPTQLILGPFHGRPACQSVALVSVSAKRPVGVCATSFLMRETVVVKDVEEFPGHIACDGVTRSEVVVPVIVKGEVVGVLDIDCEREGAFDEDDRIGLEKFVEILAGLVAWE